MNPGAARLQVVEREVWDAVIVGAGTAGASLAIQLAAQGQRVLLLEAKAFPRDKVCGGCLNQRAWSSLQQVVPRGQLASMTARIEAAGAVLVDRMLLNCLGRAAQWNTPVMHAISRRTLDVVLVDAAIESGAVFCQETTAKVIDDEAKDFRRLRLSNSSGEAGAAKSCIVRGKLAIVADGLGHSALSDLPDMASEVTSGSRLGLGATLDDRSDAYAPRLLTMAVGKTGYVGLTRVEGGKLNVAAAVDASAMKAHGPLEVMSAILRSCRLPLPAGLADIRWTGTLPLTRTSRSVAARRLFTIGDSASYVEPFTGEGMSWAIQDAVQLNQLITGQSGQDCDRMSAMWNAQWKEKLRSKQWVCRSLAGLLRHPHVASCSLVVARAIPWVPQWLIAQASGVKHTSLKAGVA